MIVNQCNHTSGMVVIVTPTDRPKSVRNQCVIEIFVEFLCCHLVFEFSFGKGAFVIRLSKVSFCFYSSRIYQIAGIVSMRPRLEPGPFFPQATTPSLLLT